MNSPLITPPGASPEAVLGVSADALQLGRRQLADALPAVLLLAGVAGVTIDSLRYLLIGPSSYLQLSIVGHIAVALFGAAPLGREIQRPFLWASLLYVYIATLAGVGLWLTKGSHYFVEFGLLSIGGCFYLVDRRYLLAAQVYGVALLLIGMLGNGLMPDAGSGLLMWALFVAYGAAVHLGRVQVLSHLAISQDALKRESVERRKAEDLALLAQKREKIGSMVGGVAHDFNNALTGIMGGLELAMVRETQPEARQEALSMALESAHSARDMCRMLLDYAHGDVAQSVPLDIPRVIEDAIRQARFSGLSGRHLERRLGTIHSVVHGDAGQLRQAIINLLTNAAEAAERVVVVSCGETEHAGQSMACISVQDDGPGIPQNVQANMFDPFYTTKPDGRGLGLAAVAAFANANGGVITVDSDAQGARLSILLPLDARVDAEGEVPVVSPNLLDSLRQEEPFKDVLGKALEDPSCLVFLKDTFNQHLQVSDSVATLRGLDPSALHDTPAARWHPDEADAYYRDDLEVIRTGLPKLGIIEQIEIKSGVKHWFKTDKYPRIGEAGEVTGVLVISRTLNARETETPLRPEPSAVI